VGLNAAANKRDGITRYARKSLIKIFLYDKIGSLNQTFTAENIPDTEEA